MSNLHKKITDFLYINCLIDEPAASYLTGKILTIIQEHENGHYEDCHECGLPFFKVEKTDTCKYCKECKKDGN